MKTSDKIPHGNSFKVPEKYFEELNSRIIASTVENQNKKNKPGIYVKLKPFLAIAASVAVLTLLTYSGMKLFPPRNEAASLSGIPVEEYPEAILNEIDILTLEGNLVLTEIPDMEPVINEKDIIDYLVLENIDINELQEQL
ncbi:MAG TPA: hypothetical protein DEO60_01470 [Bacteroidales bacterium]|jgi:hypothetical protein|nr:hypothetical protein [Bacteroidales bacterium]HBZ19771.1 hypothetical protein [Bacteroidales bacterium]